jgi:hypothetical protein
MKIETSEAEIIGLLTKTEEELKTLFLTPPWFYILPNHCCLPDLAERLLKRLTPEMFRQGLMFLYDFYFPNPTLEEEMLIGHSNRCIWLMDNYKNIKIIVLSLAALKRGGTEL